MLPILLGMCLPFHQSLLFSVSPLQTEIVVIAAIHHFWAILFLKDNHIFHISLSIFSYSLKASLSFIQDCNRWFRFILYCAG